MVSFENTEIAFKSRSDKDLKRAYLLFRLISSNILVYMGKVLSQIALKLHLPVDWAVKPTIYSHFVGGITIDECRENVRNLEKFGVKAILDYSVEGSDSVENINQTLEETLRTIHNAAKNDNIPFAVFKPTAFTRDSILEKVSAGESLTEEEQEEATSVQKPG